MIVTGIKFSIIKTAIFSKSNNDYKTELYLVIVNYLKLFPVPTKKNLRCRCYIKSDTNKLCPKVVKHAQILSSTLSPKGAYVLRILFQ